MRRVRWTTAVLVVLAVAGAALVGAAPSGAVTVVDSGYGTAGVRVEPVSVGSVATTTDASGRILAVVQEIGGQSHLRVYRYLRDGSPDATFGTGGVVVLPGEGYLTRPHIAVQGSGRILVEAIPNPSPSGTVVRALTPSGALDPTWGTGGSTVVNAGGDESAMVVRADGSVAMAFNTDDPAPSLPNPRAAIVLLDPSGHVDQSFGTGGVAESPAREQFSALAAQGDNLLLATVHPAGFGFSSTSVARVDAHGAFDATFGGGAGTVETRSQVSFAVRPDGSFVTVAGDGDPYASGFTADGRRVTPPGRDVPVAGVRAPMPISLDPSGRLLTATAAGPQLVLSRLNADLSQDPTFGPDYGAVALHLRAQPFDIPLEPHGVFSTGTGPTVVVGISDNKLTILRVVTVPPGIGNSPVGSLDVVSAGLGSVSVGGWALDPDTAASIDVHVYVDGAGTVLTANGSRPDVGGVFPAYGSAHGFGATVSAAPGAHSVCAYAINVGAGGNSLLGCRQVTVPSGSPVGSLDVVSAGLGSVSVGGWALDPDTAASIDVHVYVDGAGTVLTANGSRPDVGGVFPAYGSAHGFGATVSAAPGAHSVCAYAINVGAGGNSLLGCRQVTVP